MAKHESPAGFRIATVNVHGFANALNGRSNAAHLASILAPFNFDLIAIEEALKGQNMNIFQESLSMPHMIFGRSYTIDHGNAVLSRHPFIEDRNDISHHYAPGGTRSMLYFKVGGDHPFVKNRTFAVTHLDHMNEDDRIAQMKDFEPHRNGVSVLLGDMNALTREDYSDAYYQKTVYEKRKNSLWELPRFDLTRLITNDYGFQDVFRRINPYVKDNETATCPYGTRIDYIFFKPMAQESYDMVNCKILSTKNSTDHDAVIAEFNQRTN